MSFCHIEFNRLLADLSLQPLSATERTLLEALLVPDASVEPQTPNESACLERLSELGLAHDETWGWIASRELKAARDRGLLPQLLETR